jgi:hypothetical protein
MGKTKGLYKAEFPKGTKVTIANRTTLETFLNEWRFHHKLPPTQLGYHDVEAVVEEVLFYHGGDELYRLGGIEGIWHEQCFRPSSLV